MAVRQPAEEGRKRADWIGKRSLAATDRASTRRSPLIRILKIGLPVMAVALTGLVLAWPYISPPKELKITFTNNEQSEEHLKMLSAKFVGRDDQDRDYYITADLAVQTTKGADDVALDNLNAEVSAPNGDWYSLNAKNGVYNEKRRTLSVAGGFSIYTDKGYEVHGEAANADLRLTEIKSDKPVRGQGKEGQIYANAFRTEERGKRLIFSDGVKVILYQKTEG